MKNCPVCNTDFQSDYRKICCSRACDLKRTKALYANDHQFTNFYGSSATKGAIQELKVCADLLLMGYQVFRSVSPSSACDLIVLDKNQKPIRVEVRSAGRSKNGKMYFARHGKYDAIASVFKDHITYEGL